jgi:hypothetical protein
MATSSFGLEADYRTEHYQVALQEGLAHEDLRA